VVVAVVVALVLVVTAGLAAARGMILLPPETVVRGLLGKDFRVEIQTQVFFLAHLQWLAGVALVLSVTLLLPITREAMAARALQVQ
jgi:hypothetical protein